MQDLCNNVGILMSTHTTMMSQHYNIDMCTKWPFETCWHYDACHLQSRAITKCMVYGAWVEIAGLGVDK
jgi:hypothetical protein